MVVTIEYVKKKNLRQYASYLAPSLENVGHALCAAVIIRPCWQFQFSYTHLELWLSHNLKFTVSVFTLLAISMVLLIYHYYYILILYIYNLFYILFYPPSVVNTIVNICFRMAISLPAIFVIMMQEIGIIFTSILTQKITKNRKK